VDRKAITRRPTLEALDRELAEAFVDREPERRPPRVLLIAPMGADATGESIRCLLERHQYHCRQAGSVAGAKAALEGACFDLVILNPALSDGCGFDLAPLLQRGAIGSTKTIVLAPASDAGCAVQALRLGAVDYLSLPLDELDFLARCEAAVERARQERLGAERVARLKTVCGKLNTARHEISAQVDKLCRELVAAYEEVADQMNEVAMTSEFRTMLRQELDVEDLLRTALEYLLTKTGPTNAAVFLPDNRDQFSLGAYVNYDCPRESISVLLDQLAAGVCPLLAGESDILAFAGEKDFCAWSGLREGFLNDSRVMTFSCSHEGRCLAVVVLFRARSEHFSPELVDVIEALRPVFAEQIATVIHVHHRAAPQWPREARDGGLDSTDDSDYGFGLAA
jgi:DNA-binding response OmpR family regulator